MTRAYSGRARAGIAVVVMLGFALVVPAPLAPANVAPQPEGGLWSVDQCQFIMAVALVPNAEQLPLLPAGFRLMRPEELGIPTDLRGDSMIGVEGERCETGTGVDGEPLFDISLGSFWTPVVPPLALRDPDAHMYIFKWEAFFSDEPTVTKFQELGLAARHATTEFVVAPLDTRAYAATLSIDGGEAYTWVGGGATEMLVADHMKDFVCVGFMATEDGGLARAKVRFTSETMVEGGLVLKLDPNGFPAEVLGADVVQAYAIHGVGEYVEGSLVMP